MTHGHPRDRALAIAIAVAVAVAAALPCDNAVAQDDWKAATHWGTLKFQGIYAFPLGENDVAAWNTCDDIPLLSILDFYSAIKANAAGGVVGSFEYVFKRRVGLEISFMYLAEVVTMEFTAGAADLNIAGAPNFTFPTLGANYHFTPGRMLDAYAGGFIALGIIATGFPAENVEIAKDVALGINTGVDYYFNKSWSLGASLTAVTNAAWSR